MESINDAVSKETLIAASKGIRDEWKKRQALHEAKAAQENAERKAASAREANGNSGAKRKFEGGSDD